MPPSLLKLVFFLFSLRVLNINFELFLFDILRICQFTEDVHGSQSGRLNVM
jgi:hypothetical protein